ncbi:MAG TPA: pantoate--beta-alanine ligase, partial [Anaerolineae bacterium]|nr:pantoate--beta-alanine ligase [Anaerolineae bacterium]
ALSAAATAYAAGERDAESLRQLMAQIIDAQPLARRQYVSAADPITLQELDGPTQRALLSMAVYIGKTRLIDNLILGDT